MKKIVVILITFFSIFLISCEPEAYYFKYNSRNEEVVNIEFISYNSNELAVVESTQDMLDIEINDLEVHEILDVKETEGFISDFSEIEFFLGYSHFNLPNGIGIKINYRNGDFLIVTDDVDSDEEHRGDAILYNPEGKFIQYYGSFSWEQEFIDLMNSYFQTQVGDNTD